MSLEEQLIELGVESLKEFGYPEVNEENIFKIKIYSLFFKDILKENIGVDKNIDDAINKLIERIDNGA